MGHRASVDALKYRKTPFLCRNSKEIALAYCLKCTSLYTTDNRTFVSVITAVIIGSFLSFQPGIEPLSFYHPVRSKVIIPTALSQDHIYVNIVYTIFTMILTLKCLKFLDLKKKRCWQKCFLHTHTHTHTHTHKHTHTHTHTQTHTHRQTHTHLWTFKHSVKWKEKYFVVISYLWHYTLATINT